MRIVSTPEVGERWNAYSVSGYRTAAEKVTGREDMASGERTGAVPPGTQDQGVTLTISEAGREEEARSGKVKRDDDMEEKHSKKMYQTMMEQERERIEESGKSFRTRAKCMKIAMRLAAGDKVPLQDERYLQKHDPEMYSMAMKVRIPKPDPEEHDSVLEDEDMEENMPKIAGQEAAGEAAEPLAEGTADVGVSVEL